MEQHRGGVPALVDLEGDGNLGHDPEAPQPLLIGLLELVDALVGDVHGEAAVLHDDRELRVPEGAEVRRVGAQEVCVPLPRLGVDLGELGVDEELVYHGLQLDPRGAPPGLGEVEDDEVPLGPSPGIGAV